VLHRPTIITCAPADSPHSSGLSRRVRQAREHAGLTQRALAAKSKITHRTIIEVEAGKRMPQIDTIEVLARAWRDRCVACLRRRNRAGLARNSGLPDSAGLIPNDVWLRIPVSGWKRHKFFETQGSPPEVFSNNVQISIGGDKRKALIEAHLRNQRISDASTTFRRCASTQFKRLLDFAVVFATLPPVLHFVPCVMFSKDGTLNRFLYCPNAAKDCQQIRSPNFVFCVLEFVVLDWSCVEIAAPAMQCFDWDFSVENAVKDIGIQHKGSWLHKFLRGQKL